MMRAQIDQITEVSSDEAQLRMLQDDMRMNLYLLQQIL